MSREVLFPARRRSGARSGVSWAGGLMAESRIASLASCGFARIRASLRYRPESDRGPSLVARPLLHCKLQHGVDLKAKNQWNQVPLVAKSAGRTSQALAIADPDCMV